MAWWGTEWLYACTLSELGSHRRLWSLRVLWSDFSVKSIALNVVLGAEWGTGRPVRWLCSIQAHGKHRRWAEVAGSGNSLLRWLLWIHFSRFPFSHAGCSNQHPCGGRGVSEETSRLGCSLRSCPRLTLHSPLSAICRQVTHIQLTALLGCSPGLSSLLTTLPAGPGCRS